MPDIVELTVPPGNQSDISFLTHAAAKKSGIDPQAVSSIRILRRSIDARGTRPKYRLRIAIYKANAEPPMPATSNWHEHDVSKKPPVHVIGAGPAGYFAALKLISLGYKPIVLERGKDVQARRRDLRAIQQFSQVSPDSNYCFGEGGAGTYSDGKLYTRSKKRGSVQDVLQTLIGHGAPEDILIDAHPHIGSNKLPKIIANIRHSIVTAGGEVHFNTRVTNLVIKNHNLHGIEIDEPAGKVDKPNVQQVGVAILATGHSARDIYAMLLRLGVSMEFKPFALGVRIEHPQRIIDQAQYGMRNRGDHLPAASYQLACAIGETGVYSFCMCPGGLIVPAATAPGEIVVNGMSLSRRDSPFANAGTVVSIGQADVDHSVLAGLELQKSVERKAFESTGSQCAPAQRLMDFLDGKLSSDLPATSYIPGVASRLMEDILPRFIVDRLKSGVQVFGKKMQGYLTNEAVVVAIESRTSSPVRILRDEKTLMHPMTKGLFPCGEGAGYAGGIVSAAIDGQNVAIAVTKYLRQKTHSGRTH